MRTVWEHMNRDIRMKTKADGITQFTSHKGLVETFTSPRVENRIASSFQENHALC